MNKRAATVGYEMVVWIPRLVYLILVMMATIGIIFAFTYINVNVGDAESHILMHRLHYSPDGISRFDAATGRVYTGVVDSSGLSDANLGKLLDVSQNFLTARFVVRDSLETAESKSYLHAETYADWQPIAAVVYEDYKAEGTGRKFPHPESRYVYASSPSVMETVVITPHG